MFTKFEPTAIKRKLKQWESDNKPTPEKEADETQFENKVATQKVILNDIKKISVPFPTFVDDPYKYLKPPNFHYTKAKSFKAGKRDTEAENFVLYKQCMDELKTAMNHSDYEPAKLECWRILFNSQTGNAKLDYLMNKNIILYPLLLASDIKYILPLFYSMKNRKSLTWLCRSEKILKRLYKRLIKKNEQKKEKQKIASELYAEIIDIHFFALEDFSQDLGDWVEEYLTHMYNNNEIFVFSSDYCHDRKRHAKRALTYKNEKCIPYKINLTSIYKNKLFEYMDSDFNTILEEKQKLYENGLKQHRLRLRLRLRRTRKRRPKPRPIVPKYARFGFIEIMIVQVEKLRFPAVVKDKLNNDIYNNTKVTYPKKRIGHSNILIFDFDKKEYCRYDPHGNETYYESESFNHALDRLLKEKYSIIKQYKLKNIKYIRTSNTDTRVDGFQALENFETTNHMWMQSDGYCWLWSQITIDLLGSNLTFTSTLEDIPIILSNATKLMTEKGRKVRDFMFTYLATIMELMKKIIKTAEVWKSSLKKTFEYSYLYEKEIVNDVATISSGINKTSWIDRVFKEMKLFNDKYTTGVVLNGYIGNKNHIFQKATTAVFCLCKQCTKQMNQGWWTMEQINALWKAYNKYKDFACRKKKKYNNNNQRSIWHYIKNDDIFAKILNNKSKMDLYEKWQQLIDTHTS